MSGSRSSDQVVYEAYDIAEQLLDQIGQQYASVQPSVVVVALMMLMASFYQDALTLASRRGPEATGDVRRLFRTLWRLVVSEDESPLGRA